MHQPSFLSDRELEQLEAGTHVGELAPYKIAFLAAELRLYREWERRVSKLRMDLDCGLEFGKKEQELWGRLFFTE